MLPRRFTQLLFGAAAAAAKSGAVRAPKTANRQPRRSCPCPCMMRAAVPLVALLTGIADGEFVLLEPETYRPSFVEVRAPRCLACTRRAAAASPRCPPQLLRPRP